MDMSLIRFRVCIEKGVRQALVAVKFTVEVAEELLQTRELGLEIRGVYARGEGHESAGGFASPLLQLVGEFDADAAGLWRQGSVG